MDFVRQNWKNGEKTERKRKMKIHGRMVVIINISTDIENIFLRRFSVFIKNTR